MEIFVTQLIGSTHGTAVHLTSLKVRLQSEITCDDASVRIQWGPSSLEDRRRGSAAHAAGRVERINAEQLVNEAAGDAEHRRAAVLALGVELEGLRLGVVVAHPRGAANVAGLGVD